MRDRARNAGVYLASANWQHITYLVGIAIAVAHYITPAMAAVIVPALAHHWLQAKVLGARSLAQAAIFKAYVPPPAWSRFGEAEKEEEDK